MDEAVVRLDPDESLSDLVRRSIRVGWYCSRVPNGDQGDPLPGFRDEWTAEVTPGVLTVDLLDYLNDESHRDSGMGATEIIVPLRCRIDVPHPASPDPTVIAARLISLSYELSHATAKYLVFEAT